MAPRHVTEFVRQLTPMAVEIGDRYGIDPALIITQAAIESGWGQEVSGNNYFGVKSHGQPGGQTILTHEEVNGQKVPVYDSFRVYDSLAGSMEDYARFLSTNPRYGDVFKSRDLDQQVKAIAESGYATDSNYPGLLRDVSRMVKREMGPMPPAQIPNVVASKLDTTPQTRNVPLPRPRPTPPSMPTPRQQRLPDIGSTSSPVGPGPTSLASVQDMYGRPQTNRLDPIGLGPLSLANVQGMYGRGGVGLPPATRSVPSIPVRPAMNAIGTMPSLGQFQAQFGRPIVATQLATARPVVGFPTPVSQRPAQRTIGFPTPANMRPAMAQPQQAPLQVTVQGANSYSAPQPQYVSTTGQALQPRQTVRYNPDTNTFVPVTLYEPAQRQERRSSISGPAQSLV